MGTPGEAQVGALQAQVQQLTQQLEEERLLRRQAEETAAAMAADATRLQRARDELANAVLAAERRAAEAEEAVALQQQAAEGAGAAAQPSAAAAAPPHGDAPLQSTLKRVPSLHQDSSSMAADLDLLLTELDQERQRSEELVRTLEAAEREAVVATEKLFKAQQRIKQLESGGKRGLFGSKKAPAPAGAPDASEPALATNAAAGGGGEEGAAVQQLQQRIAALKASRDKLIGAFDAQAAEIERLSGDNAALAEVTAQLRDVAAKWEAQAQDSLSQNERLKDLLEESATWSLPATGPEPGSTPAGVSSSSSAGLAAHKAGDAAGPGSEGAPVTTAAAGGDGAALAELCQRFERELLLEKAKSAQLDLQVRALCMELTRAAQSSGQMQAALLPMLGGIEARLVQVLGMRPRQAALQA